jgi:hypothetical protein
MQENKGRARLRKFRRRNMHDFELDTLNQDAIHPAIVRDAAVPQRGMLVP